MRNDELAYDWLDFLAEQKPVHKTLLKEALQIIPVPNNLKRGPRNNKVEGIVIHHTVTGNAKTTLRVLEQRGYSTNFEIDQSGKIYQYIDPATEYAIATGNGANKHTVAIDITTGNSKWPPEQVEAARTLIYSLAQKFGFEVKLAPDQGPYDWNTWKGKGFTLFRHRNFAPTACPTSFPMEQIAGAPSSTIKITDVPTSPTKSDIASTGQKQTAVSSDGKTVADIEAEKRFASRISPEDIEKALGESLDRKIFHIKDKTKNKLYNKHEKYFDSLLDHLKNELKINKSVQIVLEDDEENAKKVLGRTGGYINHEDKIHIFCSGRHIKDIMRSLAHEMVHHKQNLRGEFKDHHKTSHGYAQKDKHLRAMEKEAYLKGNILFRDWEDNYKYRGEK